VSKALQKYKGHRYLDNFNKYAFTNGRFKADQSVPPEFSEDSYRIKIEGKYVWRISNKWTQARTPFWDDLMQVFKCAPAVGLLAYIGKHLKKNDIEIELVRDELAAKLGYKHPSEISKGLKELLDRDIICHAPSFTKGKLKKTTYLVNPFVLYNGDVNALLYDDHLGKRKFKKSKSKKK
jgi:hypothetical protein